MSTSGVLTAGPVLVTGAGGFLGRRVVATLRASGREVVALTRAACDLRDARALERVARDFVGGGGRAAVHLAAAGVLAPASWEDLLAVNVQAPLVLARALERVEGHRLLVAGSFSEVAGADGPQLLDEDAPLRGATPYGASKAAAVLALAASAREAGTRACVLRLFQLYGPGEAPARLVPYVVARLRAGEPVETSDLAQVRDLVHVDDAAAAFARALEVRAEALPAVLNVATGRATPLRDVVRWLAARLGGEGLLRIGARPRKPGEPERAVGDPARARGLFGRSWAPRSWESGLEALVAAELVPEAREGGA